VLTNNPSKTVVWVSRVKTPARVPSGRWQGSGN
jgi:hypothetical protein